MDVRMSFLCSPRRKERAVKFIPISSIIKLETYYLTFQRAILATFLVTCIASCYLSSDFSQFL